MGVNEKRKETVVKWVALIFVFSVFISAYIQSSNASNVKWETTFKVFDKHSHPAGRTHVLTYGDGKYIFFGNYTSEFELDHTYHVTYQTTQNPHETGSNPPRYFLKILKITEIPQ